MASKRAIIVGGGLPAAAAAKKATAVKPIRRLRRALFDDEDVVDGSRALSQFLKDVEDGSIASRVVKTQPQPTSIPYKLPPSKPYVPPPDPVVKTCPSCHKEWYDGAGKPTSLCYDCRLNQKGHGTTVCNKCRKYFKRQEEAQMICPGCAYQLWLSTATWAPGAERPFHKWTARSADPDVFICEFCKSHSDQPMLPRYCTGPKI